MTWIDRDYPNMAYIVEVKYSGDIAITTCQCKDMPKDRDTAYGFTAGFWSYDQAARHAQAVARELGIPTCIKEAAALR